MTDVAELARAWGLPEGPSWSVDWDALTQRFAWIRAMRGVPQDKIWHAEGDVWIHCRMVCEALASMHGWRELPDEERCIVWLGVLLHDVAKPYSTQHEGERIRSRHHSPRGAVHARRLMWEAGLLGSTREEVCGLVRHHQLPLHVFSESEPRYAHRLSAASMRCRLRLLAIVAEADIRGRHCDDKQGKLESIAMFGEVARELGCWNTPRRFASEHGRLLYFRGQRDAATALYDDSSAPFVATVTVMSGLPASGKSHWRNEHRAGVPVVSMDALRRELGIDFTDDQGRVRQAAKERARDLLRNGCDFVWDATNMDAQRRRKLVDLALDYGARVDWVAVETAPERLRERNEQREVRVPRKAIEAMLSRWVVPDLTEGHALLTVMT